MKPCDRRLPRSPGKQGVRTLILVAYGLMRTTQGFPGHTEDRSILREEAIGFSNGQVSLRGTLVLPALDRKPPFPALVMVHGSGSQTRKRFLALGRLLAEKGIASLAYDKRGTGESTGEYQTASYQALADDALAGVATLALRGDLRAKALGLWGVSQGGWILPLAARTSDAVKFVIIVSGSAQTGRAQQQFMQQNNLLQHGFGLDTVKEVNAWFDVLYDTPKHPEGLVRLRRLLGEAHAKPWFRTACFGVESDDQILGMLKGITPAVMDYDPLPAIQSLRCPTLLVFGGADQGVDPAANVPLWRHGLRQAGNPDVTIKVFPGADHGLRVKTAQGDAWAEGFLETMAEWVLAR